MADDNSTERSCGISGGQAPGGSGLQSSVRNPLAYPRVDHYRIPKIPIFIRSDPALWFLQVERTFRASRVTADDTKADIVISALDSDTVAILRDILMVEPPLIINTS